MARINMNVNGRDLAFEADDPDMPLLYALRDDMGLNGPKFGCGLGQCGACMVLVDGVAARSCTLPVSGLAGRKIVTLEGLADGSGALDKVQAAFVAEQAGQCGYCSNGMIIAARALLHRVAKPTDAQIRDELAGNLCRCGSHDRVLRAVRRAAEAA